MTRWWRTGKGEGEGRREEEEGGEGMGEETMGRSEEAKGIGGGAGVEAGKEAAIAPVAVVTRSTAWAYCCKKWRGRRRMLR